MANVSSPIIIALDYPDLESALTMARMLDPAQCRVKVGKELFTRSGPAVLERLHEMGFEVFLDLKFHDIPNTTSKAVAVAADLNVWMVNVHASGGRVMMEACAEVLSGYRRRPLLIGVTVLTSMGQSDLRETGVEDDAFGQANRLAHLAQDSGLDGIVCSSLEVAALKSELNEKFLYVTPGIRPTFAASDDQTRIMTPSKARAAGADYLVIGRPVTKAENPGQALDQIMSELSV